MGLTAIDRNFLGRGACRLFLYPFGIEGSWMPWKTKSAPQARNAKIQGTLQFMSPI
jgi:hypothetical protein